MQVNDTVTVKNETYRVTEGVGAGGQGSVWKAVRLSDSKLFALKIINEKDVNRRREKIYNIQKLINERLDDKTDAPGRRQNVNHVFPICSFSDKKSGETGYVMEYVEGETLNKMLMSGKIRNMSVESKLLLVKKIAASIQILHDFGYCYTDINWGNFMWNGQTQTMYVIDCENVASRTDIKDGKCAFLKGTGFFIAPEVAFDLAYAADNADRYALATLIFRILTNNVLQSPYHGKAMYTAVPACESMEQVKEYEQEGEIDKNWRVFVFDKDNRSNGIDDLFRNSTNPECVIFRKQLDEVIKIWNGLDERIKEMFRQVFRDPFDYANRPMAAKWITLIDEVLGAKKVSLARAGVSPASLRAVPFVSPKSAAARAACKYPTFVPRGGTAPVNSGKYKTFVPRGASDGSK